MQNVRFFAPPSNGRQGESLFRLVFVKGKTQLWGFGEGGICIGSGQVIPTSYAILLFVRDRQWNELPAEFKIAWRYS